MTPPRDDVPAGELLPLCLLAAFTVMLGFLPGLYAVAHADPASVDVLARFGWVVSACAWLDRYLKRHGYPRPMDLLMFSYGGGYVLVAYYLVRIRGRRAWAPLLALLGLWLASWLAGSVLVVMAR